MNITSLKHTAIMALILVCVLVLSACGGGSPEPDLIGEDLSPQANAEDAEVKDASPSGADDYYYIGTSLENVDVCKLIPLEDIINIVGGLREDETEAVIGQAGEVGCKYVDQKGQWYYVTYYPLGDWSFVEYTLNESEKVDGLLDGAWKGSNSSDEIHIKALAADELVMGAFVSDGLEETAIRLVELLYEYRPK